MATSPLYLMVSARPRDDTRDQARELLTAMITASRDDDGCELMEFVTAEDDASAWIVFERWTSRELWERHAATDRNRRDGERLAPLLVEPLGLRFLTPA